MSTSDGNSTTRPLRRRTSKRFDRSGGSPLTTGSTVLDGDLDDDLDVELPEQPIESFRAGDTNTTAEPETENRRKTDAVDVEDSSDPLDPVQPATPTETVPATTSVGGAESTTTDPAARSRTLEQLSSCGRCGHEVSTVNIAVDGNVLMMESCDNCDTRRWQLAGEAIELKQALDHVGEHTGRRRQ